MRNWIKAAMVAATVVFAGGCSTDLEVNAPYKEITVVYGLMSTNEVTHWVLINRAFLGEGDAFIYAQIPDSNQYTDAQLQGAVIEELDNGTVVNTYPLLDSILDNRVEGTFYNPQHKVYYFNAANLNTNRDYRFRAVAKGNEVTASTPMVNDFLINATDQNPNVKIGLVNTNGNYQDYELNWTSGKDGRRYQVDYVFKYVEVRNGTDSTAKAIKLRMGTRVSGGLDGGEALNATIDGESFYQTLSSIVQDDGSVEKRVFKGIDFEFWVASDEYHTYLQLADPVTGIVEERPDYTNITNGYGLLGSRYFKSVNAKQLNTESLDELINGQYTGTLRFCSPLTTQPGIGCN
jgi:hypothetical protein